MAREPVIRSEPTPAQGNQPHNLPASGAFDPDDTRYDDELRPQFLNEVVGQRKVIERLKIMIDAARKRGEPLGHLLLDGPPGLGKTTLATVMARELDSELQIASGPSLAAPKDLVPYLSNAQRGSVFFIDEIHRLPPAVEEFLYPAMEDFRVDIVFGEGLNARTVNMKLEHFTIIGATTRSGMLTAPLRDRFVSREHLDFYEIDDLTEIVLRNAQKLRATATPEAAQEVARRSRRTPRKANNLLRWTRDFATVNDAQGRISTELARQALEMLEVDDLGLERQDRRYLTTLVKVFTGGPAGIQAIAHSMNIPADTLEDEVEPFLLQCGFIQRTPRGRMITAAALAHLGLTAPESGGEPQGRLF